MLLTTTLYRMTYQIDSTPDVAGRVFPGIYTVDAANAAATLAGAAGTRPQAFISYPSNVLGFGVNKVTAHNQMPRSRGSWKLKELYSLTATGVKHTPLLADAVVYVTFEVTEPLLLPPFVFGSGMGKQGFYRIQTMNFQMNMLQNANRAWRSAIMGWETGNYTKNATIQSCTGSTLLFHF